MLPTVTPVDPAWLDISAQRERFKLCFANGYWDCSEDRFYEGSIPEHRFLSGVRAPLQPRDQRYVDLVHARAPWCWRRCSGVPSAAWRCATTCSRHWRGSGGRPGGKLLRPGRLQHRQGRADPLPGAHLPRRGGAVQRVALGAESSNDPAKDDQLQWVVPIFHSSIVVSNEFNLRARAAGGRTERARINSKI